MHKRLLGKLCDIETPENVFVLSIGSDGVKLGSKLSCEDLVGILRFVDT